MKEHAKLNMHIIVESVLMLFTQNYQNQSVLDETIQLAKVGSFFYTHCSDFTVSGDGRLQKRVAILTVNPLECRGNYSATSNNMTSVHWPLMGGLLHLVQRGGDWAGPQPAQSPSRYTKYSPPINGQSKNHRIAV